MLYVLLIAVTFVIVDSFNVFPSTKLLTSSLKSKVALRSASVETESPPIEVDTGSSIYTLEKRSEFLENTLKTISTQSQTLKHFHDKMDNKFLADINKKLRIDWTYNSNAIDGSFLSLDQTMFILTEGIITGGHRLSDSEGARHHGTAIDWMRNKVKEGYSADRSLVCELNQLLTGHISSVTTKDEKGKQYQVPLLSGRYRETPAKVMQPDGTIHNYVHHFFIDEQMDELFDFCNNPPEQLHPVEVASLVLYNMYRIHPFQEGNGHGARLLMNFVLNKANIPCCVIKATDKHQYMNCLKEADQGNGNPLVEFIANSTKNTLTSILDSVKIYM